MVQAGRMTEAAQASGRMKELRGGTAVITGGGSGIGRAMGLAFADAGMNVVIADVDVAAAEKTRAEIEAKGVRSIVVETDVRRLEAVQALAARAYDEFGSVQILCNNAGVVVFKTMDEMTADDWRWVLSVNLDGVVNGIQSFLPRMKAQDGPAHIVNTASSAGVSPYAGIGSYVASKYAVVGISESLHLEAKEWNIGCSVLCPGNVRTGIVGAARNRPADVGGPSDEKPEDVEADIQKGMDPLEVGQAVLKAVQADDLYIFTHPEIRPQVEDRHTRLISAFQNQG